MAREDVMSTPIFDQLLREMAQRAEPRAAAQAPALSSSSPSAQAPPEEGERAPAPRRRHRAD